MNQYLEKIDAVTGASRAAARLQGALKSANLSKNDAVGAFLTKVSGGAKRDVPDTAATVIGGAAGAVLWKNHRVLGLIGGASLGRNLPALLKPELRAVAATNLGLTGAAIVGSLALPDHPVVGFFGGAILGGGIAYVAGWRK